MKKLTIEKTILVDVIDFGDDTIIEASELKKFHEHAIDFEDTIGEYGNYTDSYLYFYYREYLLEWLLVKLDVIRLSPRYSRWNAEHIPKRYLLSDGYHKFINELSKILYEN